MICRVSTALAFVLLGGPSVSLVLTWLTGRELDAIAANPLRWFVRSVLVGCLFLLFPLFSGPPVRYAIKQLREWPRVRVQFVAMATAVCGGTAALLLTKSILDVLGLYFQGPLSTDRLIAVNCIIVAAVTAAITSHDRLRAERDAAAARAESAVLLAQIRLTFFSIR